MTEKTPPPRPGEPVRATTYHTPLPDPVADEPRSDRPKTGGRRRSKKETD